MAMWIVCDVLAAPPVALCVITQGLLFNVSDNLVLCLGEVSCWLRLCVVRSRWSVMWSTDVVCVLPVMWCVVCVVCGAACAACPVAVCVVRQLCMLCGLVAMLMCCP